MATKIDIGAKYLKDLEIWTSARSEPLLQSMIDAQYAIVDQAKALRSKIGDRQGQSLDLSGWDLALGNYQKRLEAYRVQPELAEQPFIYGYGEVDGLVIDEPDIQMSGLLFNDMVDLAPRDITWADQIRQRALSSLEAHYKDIARGAASLASLGDPMAAAYEGAARIATRASQGIEAYATGEIVARAKSRAVGTALGLGLGLTAAAVLLIAAGQGKLKLPR